MNIQKLSQAYEELCEPRHIRSIQTEEQFIQWCNIGTVKDLECALKVFELAEMYEDCILIKQVLEEKRKL